MENRICLELNDVGLRGLRQADGGAEAPLRWRGGLAESPGLASVDGGRWIFGEAARRNARLAPTETVGGFWDTLEAPEEAVSSRFPDLTRIAAAYSQLEADMDPASFAEGALALVYPSFWGEVSREAAKSVFAELKRPCRAMLDAGIAACLARPERMPGGDGDIYFLDVTRGRACLTRIEKKGERLRVGAVSVEENFGFAAAEEAVFRAADKLFLEQTRIRPSKKGENEQALFDQIPRALAVLAAEEVFTFEVAGRSAEMRRGELSAALEDYCRGLVDFALAKMNRASESGGERPFLVSERLAGVAGLAEALRRLPDVRLCFDGGERSLLPGGMRWLEAVAADGGAEPRPDEAELTAVDGISGEGPEAPSADGPDPRPEHRGRQHHTGAEGFLDGPAPSPTHLLFQGRALPLEGEVFRIGRRLAEGEPGLRIAHAIEEVAGRHCELARSPDGGLRLTAWGDGKVWVNDEAAEPERALSVGDYLGIGGHRVELMLLALVPESS